MGLNKESIMNTENCVKFNQATIACKGGHWLVMVTEERRYPHRPGLQGSTVSRFIDAVSRFHAEHLADGLLSAGEVQLVHLLPA